MGMRGGAESEGSMSGEWCAWWQFPGLMERAGQSLGMAWEWLRACAV